MLKLARRGGAWTFVAGTFFLTVLSPACAAQESPNPTYIVRHDRWSDSDERDYEHFIAAIGESDCATLNECLHSRANPFAASDPPSRRFESDCADLPYVLRFYFAWKRGLPFSYASAVAPRDGSADDIRYSRMGNKVSARTDVRSGRNALEAIARLRADISTATYRIHPDLDGTDLYSPAIKPGSIRPGTVVYDTAGHVAIVYRVDPDGRVHSFDAHTDFTLTQMTFDVRFARMRPSQGSGFKNWRPLRLTGAERAADGSLRGGHVEIAANKDIADFSTEQFYGTGPRPADAAWASGPFTVNGERLDFYDFVRARLAGKLMFHPVREVAEMTGSLCNDLQYRAAAVDLSRALASRPHPVRLPRNIYGTDGDWEMFSTPSRDARLKTAFKYLRDTAQRFVEMDRKGDRTHLAYSGTDLPADLLKAYRRAAAACTISYHRSDGSTVSLSFGEARARLFALSFDPYHCPERRWGAHDPRELATCREDADKRAWYDAEQPLRNQIDRTYDARMDFTLEDLHHQPAIATPDTDVEGYLEQITRKQARN
ncbi:hypothetical protein [Rhizomicrobium electricum]|uniref:YARHG domain-containing protein n=1 Tax=Rhizomicrobium electricum TaxID=480070 RepID=A0ABN1EPC2_9PROT|nr:hypothetical protein [Rhizomicrobium electricum]NIJ48810.1 hypothetical protein [Rhizomicrobium electricum]